MEHWMIVALQNFFKRERKRKCMKVRKKQMMIWEKEPLEAEDVEIAAKVGMNWEPAISLLLSIPYKFREQPKHKRIHPKALKGIQSFPCLLSLEWILTEAWISFWLLFTSQQHDHCTPCFREPPAGMNSGKGRSWNASCFSPNQLRFFFSKGDFSLSCKIFMEQ